MPTTNILLLAAAIKDVQPPDWLTQELLEKSAADRELQAGWEPQVGDYYFCRDLYELLRIETLDHYHAEGDPRGSLKSDLGKDDRGHWECDIFLPPPTN